MSKVAQRTLIRRYADNKPLNRRLSDEEAMSASVDFMAIEDDPFK